MSGQPTTSTPIDNVFAASSSEIYANRPFCGALFQVQADQNLYMQYIDPQERLTLSKFLDQKGITKGRFLLMKTDGDGNEQKIPFQVNKEADDDADLNPFTANMPGLPQNAAVDKSQSLVEQNLKAEIQRLITKTRRLEDKLTQAEDNRREAENELTRTKQVQTGSDTKKVLAHQQEMSDLKEAHRKEVSDYKDQLSDLKMEMKIKELSSSSEKSVGNRFMDMIQSNFDPDFFKTIAASVSQMMQAQGTQQPTPEQMQQAVQQIGQQQAAASETAPPQQTMQPNGMGDQSDDDISGQTDHRRGVDLSALNTGDPPAGKQPTEPGNSPQPETNPHEAQPNLMNKQQLAGHLQKAAMDALVNENANLKDYAQLTRQQLAIHRQNGVSLDGGEWLRIAQMLAGKAVEKQISAERIATVISPVLGNISQKWLMVFKMVDADKAADMLFQAFNIQAPGKVRKKIVEVLDIIKQKM